MTNTDHVDDYRPMRDAQMKRDLSLQRYGLTAAYAAGLKIPLTGVELIERERAHQMASHSDEHDDAHVHGELAIVANTLISAVLLPDITEPDGWGLVEANPGPIRRLIIAGALIAAEIDRRIREHIRTTEKDKLGVFVQSLFTSKT